MLNESEPSIYVHKSNLGSIFRVEESRRLSSLLAKIGTTFRSLNSGQMSDQTKKILIKI